MRNKASTVPQFWETTALHEMSDKQWESLCDGCGRCCLHKLENADTGDVYFTNLACSLFDASSCRCTDYARRSERVPNCLSLRSAEPDQQGERLRALPDSCAYRRLHEGRGLAAWHPLVSGDPATVEQAGISVRGHAVDCADPNPEVSLLFEHVSDRIVWRRR